MQDGPAGPALRVITGLTVVAWALQMLFWPLEDVALIAGFVPARFLMDIPALDTVPRYLTPLTAALVHGDILHLTMNMITFWYCGKFVERFLGSSGLIILFVIGAYSSAGLHYLVNTGDPLEAGMPMIGASGAVSAVIGAYAMLFSTSETKNWGPIPAEWVRALWLMAGWVGVQWLIGIASAASGYSIAIAAHIGGFLAGLLLAKHLLKRLFS